MLFVVGRRTARLLCDFSFVSVSSPHSMQRADPMVQVDYVLVDDDAIVERIDPAQAQRFRESTAQLTTIEPIGFSASALRVLQQTGRSARRSFRDSGRCGLHLPEPLRPIVDASADLWQAVSFLQH